MADLKSRLKRDITESASARAKSVDGATLRLTDAIRKQLNQLGNRIEGGSLTAEMFEEIFAAAKARIDSQVLKKTGRAIESLFLDEIERARRSAEYTIGRVQLNDDDYSQLEVVIRQESSRVRNQIVSQLDRFSGAVSSSFIAGEEPDIEALRERIGDSLYNQLAPELDLKLAGYNQALVNAKASEADLSLFIYLGPDDQVTREFCEELLTEDPPIYTAKEIAGMDNGQNLPVSLYCGGYNCRHQWRPISQEYALELGYEL